MDPLATGMRAHAELIVGPPKDAGRGYRVERVVQAAPVGWRLTPDAVYLVGTSAGPVGDDHVRVDVEVRPGAALTIRSSAAMVVWRGAGTIHDIRVRVGPGASLDWRPEPLVTTSGCDHHQTVTVQLEGTAALRWRDVLVLGREKEPTGALVASLTADLDGVPVLRHSLAVGPGATGWDGPAVLGPARVVALELLAGSQLPRPPAGAGPGWARHPLAAPATLAVAAGTTTTEVYAALAEATEFTPCRSGLRPGRAGGTRPEKGG
ncbi:MAG TPA: urease accessory protein UreD [Acidimicrobiales bacterium]